MCVNCGCSSCNTNSYVPDNTSALKYDGPKFVCSPDFTVLPGASLNDMLNTLMQQVCANSNSLDFEHYLGEDFGGGIIYHLWRDSSGAEHGLIVSKTELTNTEYQSSFLLINADRTEDGLYNTNLMVNSLISPAANYVNGLANGGFNDWYLPSIDELNLLFNNRFHAQKTLRNGGDTLLTTAAYGFEFGNGFQPNNGKTTQHSVRAIRSF
jgi:hypothetical protein